MFYSIYSFVITNCLCANKFQGVLKLLGGGFGSPPL